MYDMLIFYQTNVLFNYAYKFYTFFFQARQKWKERKKGLKIITIIEIDKKKQTINVKSDVKKKEKERKSEKKQQKTCFKNLVPYNVLSKITISC